MVQVQMVGRMIFLAMSGIFLLSKGNSLLMMLEFSRSLQLQIRHYQVYKEKDYYFLFIDVQDAVRSLCCFIFLLMNNLSLKHLNSGSVDIKSYLAIFSNKKVKTERAQPLKRQFEQEKAAYSPQRLMPLLNKSHEFPSIFSKRKRIEYSGYKQYNLNKSKFIKFETESKSAEHKPKRAYEVNLKNIVKLRRRYSLEPHILKISFAKEKSCEKTTPLKILDEDSIELINSEQTHQINLRQLMRNFVYQKSHQNELSQQVFQGEQTLKNVNKQNSHAFSNQQFQKYGAKNERVYKLDEIQMCEQEKRYKNYSAFSLKSNRKVASKHLKFNCRKGIKVQKQMEEEDICGWESQNKFQY